MRIWKRSVAVLAAVLLFMSALPTAFALEGGNQEVMPAGGDITIIVPGGNENESGSGEPSQEPTTPAEEPSKPTEGTTPPGEEPGESTAPSEEPTQPSEESTEPTETVPEETKEDEDQPGNAGMTHHVDHYELQTQLAIVNGLNRYDYTQASWDALQKAYEKGKEQMDSNSQTAVNAATKAIKDAIAGLVKMDYSALKDALATVEALAQRNPELHDVWIRLNAAVEQSKPLLASGDQTAVDEAADLLEALMEEHALYADAEVPPETVIQEVEVEVPPSDAFCNIPMHRVWPVLFWISLALNVALAVLVVYILMKKRNTTDDTPLVDYDIDDDI